MIVGGELYMYEICCVVVAAQAGLKPARATITTQQILCA
jgi:hypothetical protein